MAFGRQAAAGEVKEALAFIATVIGQSRLDRRWTELESQRRSAVRGVHVAQAYSLELAHHDAVTEGALELGWPSPDGNPPLLRLYAFAATLRRLHARLGERAQARLRGSLSRHYLQDVGLRPMAYEMAIAVHLSRMGFCLGFNDLEQAGGFDFLATDSSGTEIEVECKHLSADIGRKIHKNEAYTLLELLMPVFAENGGSVGDGQVLIVEVPDRLEGSRPRMDEIVGLVATAFRSANRRSESESASVSLLGEDAERRDTLWRSGLHHSARFGNLRVILRSAKTDKVIDKIERKLKDDVERQFTRLRPALLFTQVSDLSAAQLVQLERDERGQRHPLKSMASRILHSREYLSAVSLTTLGDPVAETSPGNPVGDRGVSFGLLQLSSFHPAYAAVQRAALGPEAL